MTLRNFRDAYKNAVNELPKFHMDAQKVQDEIHHKKMVKLRNHNHRMSIAAAASIFLVCSIGTAAAMNYHQSVIEMQDSGYTITGGLRQSGQGTETAGMSESAACGLEQVVLPDEKAYRSHTDAGVAAAAETGGEPIGCLPESGGEENSLQKEAQEAAVELEIIESDIVDSIQYDSLEAFQEAQKVAISFPDITWLGEKPDFVDALVSEDKKSIHVSVMAGDKYLTMSQYDHSGVISYGSSSVFSGNVTNERSITNSQGLSFTVFDTLRNDELEGVHGVISIMDIDIELGFYGCEAGIAEEAMKQMDLSIYFNN